MLRLARTVPAARWADLRPLAEATGAAAARGDRAHYAETDRAFHRAVLSSPGTRSCSPSPTTSTGAPSGR